MMAKKEMPVLVDEKLALSMFLDSLLHESVEVPVETKVEVETEVATEMVTVVEEPIIQSKETAEPVVEVSLLNENEVVTSEENIVDEPSNINEFQAMLFKVAGLTLAVPLDGLNGVVEWKDDLAEMPGHADFYLGILQHLEQRIPVVETASLVFPEEKLKSLAVPEARDRITRIVLIDESRWGLAVDSVEEVITLKHDQVRWRTELTQRKWLLGTVVEHMCALIDPTAFAEKLLSGEE